VSAENSDRFLVDRRAFLKTTGTITAGTLMFPWVGCATQEGALAGVAGGTWTVQPFPLSRVRLGAGLFAEKRDRMLNYARNYGSDTDILAGPDRLLSIFRANAGLDTKGAEPPGSWEDEVGYLRGHYAGHFMSMLAQAYASTGDEVYRQKLDYMVATLAECQAALAASAAEPTPRGTGPHGASLRLSGSPIGLAEHVRLPAGLVDSLDDFTVATWINLAEYDASHLPGSNRNQTPATLNNGAAIFDFGRPNPEYAEPALARMYLLVRASDEEPVPRFAITTSGEDGEQRLDGVAPIAVGEWTHIAVTRTGGTGTLYVNGQAVATNSGMTLGPADLGGTTDNWIGRRQFPQRAVSYLNGSLAEFQIFGRALSADEVRSLNESAGGTVGGGDVAWYRFDEGTGPNAADASGNSRDANIVAPTDGRRHPGFISAYPETQFIRLEEFCTYGSTQGIWAPYYTLHKIMAGLIDAHLLAGNEQALEILTGIGDWAWGRLEPLPPEQLHRMWDIYIAGEYGGVNESLATLHALTGTQHYLTAASRFDNLAIKDPIAAGEDVLDGRHANQHIPQFTGYLRIHEGNQDPVYYDAAHNFWDMVVPHRIYSHGGVGVGEILRERDVIAGSFYDDGNHAETCPLYNMLKLSRNLFFHEPDPKYMNYYELGLFNQIAGSRRDIDSVDSPEVTYFVPVQPGSRRRYGNTGTCCGGTGMENHTKYQDSIWFHSSDNSVLYLNLYIPSTLDWQEKRFTITQETRYPLEGSSVLTVDGSGPLDLRLRVPVWARKSYTVAVNGEPQVLNAVPGTYVSLSRDWSPGDRIEISMPFTFRVERAIDHASVQSIYWGPTLLALQSEPVGDDLESGLIPVSIARHIKLDGDFAAAMTPAGQPGHFRLGNHEFAPFWVADPAEPGAAPVQEGAGQQGPGRRGPNTKPYHMYVRRNEPRIVFGSVDTGVANPTTENGLTFLDAVWDHAPFATHSDFTAAVDQVATEWQSNGLLSASDRTAIMNGATAAESDLAV
jgi:DUF1680 family protein